MKIMSFQNPHSWKPFWILQGFFWVWMLGKILASPAHALECKLQDVAQIQGLRENQLIGYGLVVGLPGSGDSRNSPVTSRSMANLLEKFGLNLAQKDFSARNIAAVMVTATLLPFTREGERVDVGIASIGDAKSLMGGTLLMTPLLAGNQKVYAVAQGSVSVGGYYVARGRQEIQKNVTTVGTISNGAIVEKSVESDFLKGNQFTLTLERSDFILANQVVDAIEKKYGAGTAKTVNGRDVALVIPSSFQDKAVAFIAELLALPVSEAETNRVVIDERTGTVVVGGEVKISKVAITHGSLHIAIAGDTQISQPLPLTLGQTVVAQQLALRADEEKGPLVSLPAGATIEELVRSLNLLGTLPRDVVVILQNLKAAGALHAQIVAR